MSFNYGEEKRKFIAAWAKTAKFYAEQGMSQEAIAEMLEYDWDWFKAQRIEALHTQPLALPEDNDGDDSFAPESPLLKKFFEQLTSQYDTYGSHSRYWWIEELSSPRLIQGLRKLSESDKNVLTLYFVEGYTQCECADILHISQCAFNKKLAGIFSIFTEK